MGNPVEKEKMSALPSFMYGDPANCLDKLRGMRASAKRKAMRDRQHKSLRIQASVKKAMEGRR